MEQEKVHHSPERADLDSVDHECKALYKKLAEDHLNKDVYVGYF